MRPEMRRIRPKTGVIRPERSRHPPETRRPGREGVDVERSSAGNLLINGLTPGTSRHPPETPPGHRIDTPSQFLHNFYFTLLIPPYSLNVCFV